MTIKNWVLGQLHGAARIAGRPDLAPREPSLVPPGSRSAGDGAEREHLGAYATLVGAVRDELEHFVASHVRLHLAIAERDRFVLTAIGVSCNDAGEGSQARALLDRFMREFRPEQIKRFLAREVIAALPNAAAIDLSQFAGLYDADAGDPHAADGEYAELLAALNTAPAAASAYAVSIVGRWSEAEATRPGAAPPSVASAAGAPLATVPFVQRAATPVTPLAGQRVEFELEDADGRRRVVLPSVLPGRRYVVGKGEGCDLRASGTYVSRRHAEVWRDDDADWWVVDAGSTNGVRIEAAPHGGARDGAAMDTLRAVDQPQRLPAGARIVLSARAEGPASDYPWLALRATAPAAAPITPIAATVGGTPAAVVAPRTPLTAILTAAPVCAWRMAVAQAAGAHTIDVRDDELPFTIGRSRNQSLVIDRRHEGVSGHHLEITALDDEGAAVIVHGDNGVQIDGTRHAAGSRLRWHAGQTMRIGAAADEAHCTLTLQRAVD
jgi:pSer/pThr/pTyr-binding forkhead associated (FHA) protein